jgi:hypothetical protein
MTDDDHFLFLLRVHVNVQGNTCNPKYATEGGPSHKVFRAFAGVSNCIVSMGSDCKFSVVSRPPPAVGVVAACRNGHQRIVLPLRAS